MSYSDSVSWHAEAYAGGLLVGAVFVAGLVIGVTIGSIASRFF
jgi:F0F1-type ATP synthase assembly protein I